MAQLEQLHLSVPLLRSTSAWKRTAPQWQLPEYVFRATKASFLSIRGTWSKLRDARRRRRHGPFGGQNDVIREADAAPRKRFRRDGGDQIAFWNNIDKLAVVTGGEKRVRVRFARYSPEVTVGGVHGRTALIVFGRRVANEILRNDLLVAPSAVLEVEGADLRHVARSERK